MSYGLEVFNSSGVRCFSTDAGIFNYHYLGAASFESDQPAFGGRLTRYSISASSAPIAFIGLASTGLFAIREIRNVGGGVWHITIVDTDLTGNSNTRRRPAVYCFGKDIVGSPTAYGAQVFDGSWNLICDLSRNPLVISELRTPASVSSSPIALGGYAVPAIHATSTGEGWSSTFDSSAQPTPWFVQSELPAMRRNANGTVDVGGATWLSGFFADSSGDAVGSLGRTVMMVDMAKYL